MHDITQPAPAPPLLPPSVSLPSINTSHTTTTTTTLSVTKRPNWTSSHNHHSSTNNKKSFSTNHLSLPPLLAISPNITNPTRSSQPKHSDPVLLLLPNHDPKNNLTTDSDHHQMMPSSRIQILSLIYLASHALNLPHTITALHQETNFNLVANISNHTSLATLLHSRSFDAAIDLVKSIITRNNKIGLPLIHYIQFLSIMHIFGRSDFTTNHNKQRAGLHAAQEALHLIRDANLRKYIHLRLTQAPPSKGDDSEVTLLIDHFWENVRAYVLGVPIDSTDTIICSAIHVAAQYFMDSVALLNTFLPPDPNSWSTILMQDKLKRDSPQLYSQLGTRSIHPSQKTTQPNPIKNHRIDSAIQRENVTTSRQPPITTKSNHSNLHTQLTNPPFDAIQSVQSRRVPSVLHRNGLHESSSKENADGIFNLNELPPALDFHWDSPAPPPHWTHAHHFGISTDLTLGPFPGTVCAMAVADYQGSLLIALAMDTSASTAKSYAGQQGRRILIIHSGRTISRLSPPSSKATVTYLRFLGNTEPHSSWLLASDTDANVTMWHWPSGQRYVWRKWHRRVVYQVIGFPGRSDSRDRAVLVSCGADHAIRIWGVASCPPVESSSKSSNVPTAVKEGICGGGAGIQAGPVSIHSNAPFVALCFVGSTTESQVLIAAQTYSLRVYKARTLTLIHTFQLDYHKHNKLPVCSLHLVPTPHTSMEFSAPVPGTHGSLSIPVPLTEAESNSLTVSSDSGPALIISSDAGAHLRQFYLNKNAYSRTYAARELDLPRTVSGMQPSARNVSVSPCGTLVSAPGHPHDRPVLIWRTRSGRFVLKGSLENMHDRDSIMGPVCWYAADTLISTVMDHANGQRSANPACTTLYVWRVVNPAFS